MKPQPENFYFGGGVGETMMHPLVAIALVVIIILILTLARKRLITVFLCSAFLIPLLQTLVIGGVHLFLLRIVILFGCARMLFTKFSGPSNLWGGRFDSQDKVFLLWAVLRASAFLILFSFQSGAIVNQIGFLLDVLGGYFFLRFLVQDDKDALHAIRVLSVIAIIIGVCMLNEKLRGQNVFGYLGGYPPVTPQLRDGAIRAQGSFSHPILAGTFGATLVPLFLILWKSGNSKWLSIAGVIASTCIVVSSASSTPLLAYAAGLLAVFLWPIRRQMRLFRWGLLLGVIALHLVMKAPVWFLIARVNVTGVSSGFHRAELVDTFIRHFGDWWLIGTNNNSQWGYEMWDLSNQFVAEGITGGLATFVCFIALISIGFGKIGRARKAVEGDSKQEWFMWLLGAVLFSHVVAFFGISYFDHTQISWFTLFAVISATTATRVLKTAEESQAESRNVQVVFSAAPFPNTVQSASSSSRYVDGKQNLLLR